MYFARKKIFDKEDIPKTKRDAMGGNCRKGGGLEGSAAWAQRKGVAEKFPAGGAERRTGPERGGAVILGTPTERKGEGPKVSPGPVERKAKSPAEILRFSRKGLPILFR